MDNICDEKYVSKDLQWVKDNEKVRGYDGKTMRYIKGDEDHGTFKMRVSETGPNGERNKGHVLVEIERLTEADVPVDGFYRYKKSGVMFKKIGESTVIPVCSAGAHVGIAKECRPDKEIYEIVKR